jgi:hypothetical protein
MPSSISLSSSVPESERFVRERALQVQRSQYRWQHLAGFPACADGVPDVEKPSGFSSELFDYDIGVSLASAAISAIGWTLDKRDAGTLRHYDTLYALRRKPAVA